MIKARRISFQIKLVIFFVILTIAFFIPVGTLVFKRIKADINSSKKRELITLSDKIGNTIDRFLFERYGDIQVMAQSPLFKNKNVDNKLKLEYIESVRNAYKTYDYIFLSDSSGNVKVLSGNLSNDIGYKFWLTEALRGKIVVSNFILDNKNLYNIYFAAPVFDKNNKISGAVVEKMNFNSIQNIIKNVAIGKKGYAYLTNNRGNTFLFPQKYNFSLQNEMDTSTRGTFYSNHENTQYISAFSKIKKFDTQKVSWYLVVEQPVKEAFDVTTKFENYTIGVWSISLIILIILIMIMSRIITKPIRKLVEEAQNITERDIIKGNVHIDSNDEIGSLAKSFNAILSNLQEMMNQVLEISGEVASLSELREYTYKFFEDIPNGLIIIDNTGKITTFNKEAYEIIGLSSEELVGKYYSDFLNSHISSLIDLLKDSLENQTIYIKHIIKIKNNYGKELPIMINTSIQKDNSGNLLGVVGIFRTLREIEKFEESVLRAKNLASLGALSAGVAHEIRNPLTSIKGYAQYVKLELGDNNELSNDMDIILSEVDRLNDLIDRFLKFARPEKPKLELGNINNLILSVVKLVNKDAQESNVIIKTKLQNMHNIYLDYDQMEQVLINLMLNSIQAMPQGGELKIISSIILSDTLEIIISDTGIGIQPDDFDKIFQPFFTTKNKGTGLGLAICYRIIENHGGLIEVNSKVNLGTNIIIKLPIKK